MMLTLFVSEVRTAIEAVGGPQVFGGAPDYQRRETLAV